MMQFDREKMRAVILRACHSCDPSDLGAVKLNKVLYYLDMLRYVDTRSAVTGAVYRKRPNGPASDQLLFQLRDMARAGDIEIRDVEYHGYIKKEYRALVAEPVGVLNDEEIALLDDVIDFVCRHNTAKSISDYSHSLPWEIAPMGGVMPYHTAMLLLPSQPSPEAFEIAERESDQLGRARSEESSVGMSKLSDFRGRILEAIGQR